MKFYLGTHVDSWLSVCPVSLFVSARRLKRRKTLKPALCSWALDSGGFTELSTYGEWRTSSPEYVRQALRYEEEVGKLDWAAPQDWMCEPFVLEKTKKSVLEHQRLTVENFVELRSRSEIFVPVLQGWTLDDYLRCVELYEAYGVNLTREKIVGVGSVCRRQNTSETTKVILALSGFRELNLHGFGVKTGGLAVYGTLLVSADSMAWSLHARKRPALSGCSHKSCSNCMKYALAWRERLLETLRAGESQQKLFPARTHSV